MCCVLCLTLPPKTLLFDLRMWRFFAIFNGMQESFLHFVWRFQYFERASLETTSGEALTIFDTGMHNTNSGPDFSHSRMAIKDIEWHGQVEIHIRSSDWQRHRHHVDPAYDNVILHVVWEDDRPVYHKDGTLLPTLVLQNKVSSRLINRYESLVQNLELVPCSSVLREISPITKLDMNEKALMSRLSNKTNQVLEVYHLHKGDWEQTTFQWLAANFGFKVNRDAFFSLGASMPYKLVAKHNHKLLELEALLFGQAGLLNISAPRDAYEQALIEAYQFLAYKYQIEHKQMGAQEWKFLRLRPANFPTLRIAQFAALFHGKEQFFSRILEAQGIQAYHSIFEALPTAYWQRHYQFGKLGKEKSGGN